MKDFCQVSMSNRSDQNLLSSLKSNDIYLGRLGEPAVATPTKRKPSKQHTYQESGASTPQDGCPRQIAILSAIFSIFEFFLRRPLY